MFRYRIIYCTFLSAAILFYIFFNGYLSFFTLIFVLLLPFISLIFLLLSIWKTCVKFNADSFAVNRNDEFKVCIYINNKFIFPIAKTQIKFNYTNVFLGDTKEEILNMPINSRSEQRVEYSFKSNYCGKIKFKILNIKYYDCLGIFSVTKQPNDEFDVFVTPNIYFIDTQINDFTTEFETNVYDKNKPGNDPSEIFDIRNYRMGDRLRNIHWKLSSKLNTLMVKELSRPIDEEVLIMLEMCANDRESINCIIETFASLSNFFLSNNIKHRVQWFDIKNNQQRYKDITSKDDLSFLLNEILSSEFYKDKPHVLNCINNYLEESSFNFIYITSQITDELAEFYKKNQKISVIYINKESKNQNINNNVNLMGVNIIDIQPGKVQESLFGFTL